MVVVAVMVVGVVAEAVAAAVVVVRVIVVILLSLLFVRWDQHNSQILLLYKSARPPPVSISILKLYIRLGVPLWGLLRNTKSLNHRVFAWIDRRRLG